MLKSSDGETAKSRNRTRWPGREVQGSSPENEGATGMDKVGLRMAFSGPDPTMTGSAPDRPPGLRG